MDYKKIIFIFAALLILNLLTAGKAVAEIRVFRTPTDDHYSDGVQKGKCYPMSLTENISAKTVGQTGTACMFSLEANAVGEWVYAGGYFDTPPYAWGSDHFYNSDKGDFSYTCGNPSYTLDETALPGYVEVLDVQDIPGSTDKAPGKKYTMALLDTAPQNSSFNVKLSYLTNCTMKLQGGLDGGIMKSVDPSDANPNYCGRGVVVEANPRKGELTLPITVKGSCITPTPSNTPTPTPTPPPTCSGNCIPGVDSCPLECPICAPSGSGNKCLAPTATPTTPPVCGGPCAPGVDTCPLECSVCVPGANGNTCVAPTPTPTTPPVCGEQCVPGVDECPIDCSICAPVGSDFKCLAPTPTPTSPPVCGGPCVPGVDTCPLECAICAAGPSGNTCLAPTVTPSLTPTPTLTPTITPTPPPVCGGPCTPGVDICPENCAACAPSSTGQGTVCRVPASCNCDGFEYSGEVGKGNTVTYTGYGKVENPDNNDAVVLNMTYHVERDGVEIASSNQIPVSAPVRMNDAQGNPMDRYSTNWDYTIPADGSGESTYRAYVKIQCTYKSQTQSQSAQPQSASAGQAGEKETILGRIVNFLRSVLGFGKPPSVTPLAPLDTGIVNYGNSDQFIFESTDPLYWTPPQSPTGIPDWDTIKLGTFNPYATPTPYIEQSCKQMLFKINY